MDSAVAAKDLLWTIATVLAVGVPLAALSWKIRVPDVAVFLLAGLFVGPGLLDLVVIPADGTLNQAILIFGAAYLVFDGGASLRFAVLRKVWITIVTLAVPGVLITAAVTATAAHLLLGLPPTVAMLLGAVIASTDPATLVPILKQVRVRERVAQTVVSESAFNDATGAVLTFGVLAIATGGGDFSLASATVDFLRQTMIGLAVGGGVGYATAFLIAHARSWARLSEFSPAVSILATLVAYLLADRLHASGFMAVFVLGVMVGNRDSFGFTMRGDHLAHLETWMLHQTSLLRMFVFILLGTQVDFAAIRHDWAGGVAVVAVFMVVARPLCVLLCALPDRRARWSLREMAFMCWVRETGVIPAALAGMLAGRHAPGAEVIVSVTFIAVLATVLIQGTTTRWLAGRLSLLDAAPHRPKPAGAELRS